MTERCNGVYYLSPMESLPLLRDIIILMGVSIPIIFVFHRLGMPTIVGFLATGIIIGPHGLGLITETSTVENLAQIGVVMLLFTIGLELSFAKLRNVGREAVIGGGLQIIFTTAIVIIIAGIFKEPLPQAMLFGFIIAQSSTAIILKILSDRGEIDSSHGRLCMGIVIVQDIAVVPMVILLQHIGKVEGITAFLVAKSILTAGLAVAAILTAAYILVPRILYQVVKLRNREIFIITALFLCLGIAWLTSRVGLSLAIGAFIAGLVISESEYSHQIVAEVLPFRDVFSSLFFISIGMLLEFNYFLYHLPYIFPMACAIIILKILVIIGIGQILRYPLRLAIIVGIGLSNIGEFSFVLMKAGEEYGLLSKEMYQTFIAASILTMLAIPLLFEKSRRIALRLTHIFGAKGISFTESAPKGLANHVIIAGYGLNGRNTANVLKATGIEYIILDMNADRISKAKKKGHRAFFGDISHPEILKKAGVKRARIIVFAVSDPVATRMALKAAKDINPSVYAITRTRYIGEVEALYKLGANQVISEEFETSVEIFARVLGEYHIPTNIIQNQIDLIRHEGYAMLRDLSLPKERLMELSSLFAASITSTFLVTEDSQVIGKTLVELDLRKKTGTTIIAIVRGSKAVTSLSADITIHAGDVLVLLGSHAQLDQAVKLLTR
ncbi:MAG TPA: cation:proton antiporter [Thermodesulfobacteriota bacterium]|nr:cation:proton antiporter [Thermodesulfobacteriota bacterium]